MMSPEAFVEKEVYDDPESVPNSFRCLGLRQWDRGVIVIYHVTSAQQSGPLAGQLLRMFMCRIIERSSHLPDGWRSIGGGGFDDDSDDSPPPECMLLYAHGTGGGGPFAIVYGCSLSSQVYTAEAVFDNGDAFQDCVTNGVFALLSPHKTFARELRAYAQDGRVLCQYSFLPPGTT